MDAALLYIMIYMQGDQPVTYPPEWFPSVAACEDYVTMRRRIDSELKIFAYRCEPWSDRVPPANLG